MMLSKNKVSEITALHQKKHRQSTGLFIVEGEKIVDELLSSKWQVDELFATADLFEKYHAIDERVQLADPHLFSKISTFKTPAGILAIVKQASNYFIVEDIRSKFTLCLDGVRDPGNLGTIIRIADWFGITNIVCSEDTVDVYNPKTIQATMGSFMRVKVSYAPLVPFLISAKAQDLPLFGAVLNGENVYQKKGITKGIIVMGSESHGLSAEVLSCIDEPITIPSKLLQSASPVEQGQSIDSLNVAIATSVICAVFAK
jgi:TrmH family RNA methyltransferase